MKVQWTKTAFESLAEIKSAIAREKSPVQAKRWLESVFAAANRLLDYPHLGTKLEDGEGLREVPLDGYGMVYRVEEPEIIILVFHSKVAAGEGGDEFPNA